AEVREQLTEDEARLTSRSEELDARQQRLDAERADASDEELEAAVREASQASEQRAMQEQQAQEELTRLEPDKVETLAVNAATQIADAEQRLHEDRQRRIRLEERVSM